MTAGRIVRTSKFRHVFGTSSKKESCYDGAQISLDSNDWHLVKANTKYLSIHWDSAGGGSFLIHPLNVTGRIASNPPLYTGHAGPVLDTDFHPFNEQVIASAGEDGRILLWNIPETGSTESSNQYAGELKGHERRIIDLEWNPVVDSLLASASHDLSVRLWDVKVGTCQTVLTGHCDAVLDQSWSLTGDRLVTSCRDKALRIFDPRQGTSSIMEKAAAHPGVKGIRVIWLGDGEQVVSTGFGRASEREVSLWDIRNFSNAVTTLTIDSASGPLLPFYDADCHMLYLAGRGDGNIRYYEVIPEAPHLYALSEYRSTDPQRSLAMLPKRAMNVGENEIARFIKVYGSQPILEPISFKVPRRENGTAAGGGTFAADIYPETLSSEPTLTSSEFFAGITRPPRRMSLETKFVPTKRQELTMSKIDGTSTTDLQEPKGEEQLLTAWRSLREENERLKGELDQKVVRVPQAPSTGCIC